jgi:hypothetical protein
MGEVMFINQNGKIKNPMPTGRQENDKAKLKMSFNNFVFYIVIFHFEI